MEAPGVALRALALVVEKDEGPRLVMRYDPFPGREAGSLFTDLAPKDLAKLFCAKKALRDALVEVQLDDALVVSCPAEAEPTPERDDASVAFWGDAEDAGEDEGPASKLKQFDVLWCATGAKPGDDAARGTRPKRFSSGRRRRREWGSRPRRGVPRGSSEAANEAESSGREPAGLERTGRSRPNFAGIPTGPFRAAHKGIVWFPRRRRRRVDSGISRGGRARRARGAAAARQPNGSRRRRGSKE